MADSTVFDSVFKTMAHRTPRLLIPFINEVFGRQYSLDEDIVQFSNEHEGPMRRVIDDSVFRLGDKIYHLECQSTPDTDMVVRMIEYDFSIALEQALAHGAPYRMEFPASCVLFLRHTSKTPDTLKIEVVLPDGRSFEYRTKVMKAQLVSRDELFRKHLLVLLPFYLLRYEKELSEIAGDDEKSAKLIAECTDLRMRLADQTLGEGDDQLYEKMVELIIKVSDHILAKYEPLQKKVRAAMGGEVLELMDERAERMEREAREKGVAQGHAQGLEEGRAEGREQGRAEGREEGREQGIVQGRKEGREEGLEQGRDQAVSELTERLTALGVDKHTIDEAIATMGKASSETLEA